MRLLDFSVWIIWRTCWSSGVLPGNFHWTVWIGIWSWWGDLWKWGAEESFQERRPHGYPWELIFFTFNSISPFLCIHVLATSLCVGANEERPVRFGQEKFSTGVESESQIWLKKAIVRRRLAPLSKSRIAKKDPFCSSVDRSRTFLRRVFDEGNALVSWWRFPVWFLIWSSLHLVSVLWTSLLQILLLRAQMSPGTRSCLISVRLGSFRGLLGWL